MKISVLNQTYIECRKTQAKAFFTSNNELFYFTSFIGKRTAFLYQFYLAAQKIHMSFFENMTFNETIRPNDVYKGLTLFVQDFAAPFYLWLKPQYSILYSSSKAGFTKNNIILKTKVTKAKEQIFLKSEITIGNKGFEKIRINETQLILL